MDWTKFTTRIDIEAEPDIIFNAWSRQDEIEKWFLSLAEFRTPSGDIKDRHDPISKGDTYKWLWHGSDFVAEGEVLSNNGVDKIEFTFLGCNVKVEVKEEEGYHILDLEQSNIPTDEASKLDLYAGCTSGWTFYLANLKAHLEGGMDLRNKQIKLKNMINT